MYTKCICFNDISLLVIVVKPVDLFPGAHTWDRQRSREEAKLMSRQTAQQHIRLGAKMMFAHWRAQQCVALTLKRWQRRRGFEGRRRRLDSHAAKTAEQSAPDITFVDRLCELVEEDVSRLCTHSYDWGLYNCTFRTRGACLSYFWYSNRESFLEKLYSPHYFHNSAHYFALIILLFCIHTWGGSSGVNTAMELGCG